MIIIYLRQISNLYGPTIKLYRYKSCSIYVYYYYIVCIVIHALHWIIRGFDTCVHIVTASWVVVGGWLVTEDLSRIISPSDFPPAPTCVVCSLARCPDFQSKPRWCRGGAAVQIGFSTLVCIIYVFHNSRIVSPHESNIISRDQVTCAETFQVRVNSREDL